ncbi:MAG: hypothetical protein ACK4GC_02515 [Paracoccaceae bacterium]
MFSKIDLTTLIEAAPDVAVSLYLPTQTLGRETRQNPIMLKNLLAQAADALAERDMTAREVEAFLAPAAALVEDYDFWQHQDHGLALFLSDAGMQIHKLPIPVPELAVTGAGFHIAPLLPLQEQDAPFMILTMTAEAAKVWQATRFSLTAKEVADLPASIESLDEEADYEGPLQSHGFGRPNTGGQSMPKTQVYGDSPEEWRKGRLVEFARRAGLALAAYLARHPQKVVVVADAAVGGHVRNDVALTDLVAGFVEVNPATLSEDELLTTASAVMQPLHDNAVGAALERFDALLGRGDATGCIDPAALVSAAQDGRVDQLFLARDAVLRGTLDPETKAVLVTDAEKTGTLDLLDKAAQMALGNGGVVWLVAQDRLPEGTAMAAILRY